MAQTLQDRLREHRELMARRDPIDLDVPGYPGLVARYHALSYREERKLFGRQATNPDEAEAEIMFAVDALINACDGLFDRQDGKLVPLEHKWDVQAALNLFGVDMPADEAPTARQAVLAIFPDDRLLMRHFVELEQRSDRVIVKMDADLPGESVAG